MATDNKSLKLCSYNVNGLYNKLNFHYFFDYLHQQDVFCCLETHIYEETKQNQINKYFPNYNLHWKSAERVSSRGRGISGLLIGWRRDLKVRLGLELSILQEEGFSIIYMKSATEIIRILPVYLRNEIWDCEFMKLKTYVSNHREPNMVLMGDVNIRMGELQQPFVAETQSNPKVLSTRRSHDKQINRKGREFVEMCDDYNLRILNGAFDGDSEGAFTYASVLGESVNDIMAVSNTITDRIHHFKVDNATWSDHFPLAVIINFKQNDMDSQNMKLLPKLMWKPNQKDEYRGKVERQISNLNEVPSLKSLCSIIKSSTRIHQNSKKNVRKQRWFDRDCERARSDSFKKLTEWRDESDLITKAVKKNVYIKANRAYNQLILNKKESYYEDLKNKLLTVRDVKKWWALANEYKDEHFSIGTNVTIAQFWQYFKDLLNPICDPREYHFAFPIIEDPLLDAPILCDEVVRALAKLKDGKAPGEDRIPYEFFKYAPENFHQMLASSFTNILDSCSPDDSFFTNIIFPILKKGNPNLPDSYRGITFMNCGPKAFMSVLTTRLTNWVEARNKLLEYQAGFRSKYSTVDSIYNLSCIVHLKLNEGKKVYAFFVDFKAAFDCVPRKALIYKLSCMGVSSKFLNLLSRLYDGTKSAVWNGESLSDYFETRSGVKQGCLLSPLLFALFLNDLHDELGAGLNIGETNIRILLYADDIVIFADKPHILQLMINRLERYCMNWSMKVNLSKSKIMVFRRGGKLANHEKWTFNRTYVEVVNSYVYLGVKLTPQMSFTEHVEDRSRSAKASVYGAWAKLLSDDSIHVTVKISMFKAAVRAIQVYASQVFGYEHGDLINKLQLFFLKYVLRLPEFTPTYAVYLETKEDPSSLFALQLHMNYIHKTLFTYDHNRLPHILSHKIVQKKLFWFKSWTEMENNIMVRWQDVPLNPERWKYCIKASLENYRVKHQQNFLLKKEASETRFYKELSHHVSYLHGEAKGKDLMYIAKARCDVLGLNANNFDDNRSKMCPLCSLNKEENIFHFFGECLYLQGLRCSSFSRSCLTKEEVIDILNGTACTWGILAKFIKEALYLRNSKIEHNSLQ